MNSNNTAFAVVSGVAFMLVFQVIFALIGLGVGILAVGPVTAGTFIAGFIWWLASGIVAAAVGGYVVGIVSTETDVARVGFLALVTWAIASVLVAVIGGASAGASVFTALTGPVTDLWTQVKNASGGDFARKAFVTAALSSAAGLVLGALAAAFMAIEARNPLHMKRRRAR
jgi:hypothetical protein